MNKEFIQLCDDNFNTYIVNINNISVIDVDGLKVWMRGNRNLEIRSASMQRLLKWLVGDSE